MLYVEVVPGQKDQNMEQRYIWTSRFAICTGEPQIKLAMSRHSFFVRCRFFRSAILNAPCKSDKRHFGLM